jgi:hypothetical protein
VGWPTALRRGFYADASIRTLDLTELSCSPPGNAWLDRELLINTMVDHRSPAPFPGGHPINRLAEPLPRSLLRVYWDEESAAIIGRRTGRQPF